MANPIIQQISNELEALHKELTQFKSTVDYLNSAKSTILTAKETVDSAKDLLSSKADDLSFTYETMLKFAESVNDLVKKVESIDFPVRLEKIEGGFQHVSEIISQLNSELTDNALAVLHQIKGVDFNQKFLDLQNEVNKTISSSQKIVESIEKQNIPLKIDIFEKNVSKSITESSTNISNITQSAITKSTETITSMNIPIRIDKLDANIAGLLAAIQNVQSRIETAERSIIDKIKDENEKNLSSIDSNQKELLRRIEDFEKSQKELLRSERIRSYITWGLLLITLCATSIFCYLSY